MSGSVGLSVVWSLSQQSVPFLFSYFYIALKDNAAYGLQYFNFHILVCGELVGL